MFGRPEVLTKKKLLALNEKIIVATTYLNEELKNWNITVYPCCIVQTRLSEYFKAITDFVLRVPSFKGKCFINIDKSVTNDLLYLSSMNKDIIQLLTNKVAAALTTSMDLSNSDSSLFYNVNTF
jgi:hypothetical protein